MGAATGAPLGAATAGASLGVAVRVRVCNCEALAAEVRLYFLRAALAPTSDAPTDFSAAPGTWDDNASPSLGLSYEMPSADFDGVVLMGGSGLNAGARAFRSPAQRAASP